MLQCLFNKRFLIEKGVIMSREKGKEEEVKEQRAEFLVATVVDIRVAEREEEEHKVLMMLKELTMSGDLMQKKEFLKITLAGGSGPLVPLHIAVKHDKSGATITSLLSGLTKKEKLALLEKVNFSAQTPLHIAAQCDRTGATIDSLLSGLTKEEKLALLNKVDEYKCTPLHIAATYDKTGVTIDFLLSNITKENRLALLEKISNFNFTPLHTAAKDNGTGATIDSLLSNITKEEKLALLEKVSFFGYTPLHMLARHNETVTAMDSLLSNITTEEKIALLKMVAHGRTPLHSAAQCEGDETGATIDSLLSNITKEGRLVLLERVDNDGCTPLHIAAVDDKSGAIITSLLSGLTIEGRLVLLEKVNNNGWTPLFIAAKSYESGVAIKTLLHYLNTSHYELFEQSDLYYNLNEDKKTRYQKVKEEVLKEKAQILDAILIRDEMRNLVLTRAKENEHQDLKSLPEELLDDILIQVGSNENLNEEELGRIVRLYEIILDEEIGKYVRKCVQSNTKFELLEMISGKKPVLVKEEYIMGKKEDSNDFVLEEELNFASAVAESRSFASHPKSEIGAASGSLKQGHTSQHSSSGEETENFYSAHSNLSSDQYHSASEGNSSARESIGSFTEASNLREQDKQKTHNQL
jgi:ankyrin repeat protein